MEYEHLLPDELLMLSLEKAIVCSASDIHFDPQKEYVLMQMRIHGILQNKIKLQLTTYKELRSKIKIKCNFRIDDHVTPKDGSFEVLIKERLVRVRVSILATYYGENIVLRINPQKKSYSLLDIGFNKEDGEYIINSLIKPGSIGIVMGPTGSGKTTTLYALLYELKNDNIMVVTVEDPLEHQIEDVRQIHISSDKSLLFSDVLRSILRQDPDLILIGEIRDYDTALLAFQAALTGHIVITSIHAHKSSDLIPRLMSLGLPEYLLKELNIFWINQRLVEKVCPVCRDENGCKECSYTGIGGRILTYELLKGKTFKEKILELVESSQVFYTYAKKYL